MSAERFSYAFDGGLSLPEAGRIALFGPLSPRDIAELPKERCVVIQPFKPFNALFEAAGYDCAFAPEGDFAAAIVFLPRAKALAHQLIASAAALNGLTLVDGAKSHGVESVLKACKQHADVQGSVSKAHGKLFWFEGGDFADWQSEGPQEIAEGFVTLPGVFSADGIDPASQALAEALPDDLGKSVADLGAGWGYLSHHILQRSSVATLHLVEADHTALQCARRNVEDARAAFHWADATTWQAPQKMNTVVMNPPFHTGRAADPDLGRAFIAAAARNLAPNGQLWMVANRHLPYEATLAEYFSSSTECAGDNRFKIFRAERPTRRGR